MIMRYYMGLAVAGLIMLGLSACSGPVENEYEWVDWKGAGEAGATGNAAGITVEYDGDLNANSKDDDTADDLFSGWPSTFTHEDVGVAPAGGDVLRMYGGEDTGPQTFRFSPPAHDPVIAVVSLGSTSKPARLVFDDAVEVLVSGPGRWGGVEGALKVGEDGTTVMGREAYGLVRIKGTYERLSFDIPDYEADYGLQIAVRQAVE